jgi:hypothetical protein
MNAKITLPSDTPKNIRDCKLVRVVSPCKYKGNIFLISNSEDYGDLVAVDLSDNPDGYWSGVNVNDLKVKVYPPDTTITYTSSV